MARRLRSEIVFDGCSFHVTWRCHNRDWLLGPKWAKRLYYGLLLQYKDKYGIQFHAYQLMENHPHLIGTMGSRERFSAFFQVVNNVFARKCNRRKKRCGQVVMDRFKSPRIKDDGHMLNAMTYSDLNGVRCKRDEGPEDAEFSSYAYYAHGKDDPLITPAPSYLTLGKTPEERQKAYREMVQELMHQDRINISNTYFIGNPDWVKEEYEKMMSEVRAKREERNKKKNRPPPMIRPDICMHSPQT